MAEAFDLQALLASAAERGLKPNGGAAMQALWRFHPNGPWTLFFVFPDRTDPYTAVYTVDQQEYLPKLVERENARGKNVYVLINETAPGEKLKRNPEKEQIRRCRYLHADVDPRPLVDLAAERKRIIEHLTGKRPKGVPEPTHIVYSGGGYQAWFQLETPVDLDGSPGQWTEFERYNEWLEKPLGGDVVKNVNRVFRLPGTVNWPDEGKLRKGRQPELAVYLGGSGKSYPLYRPA